jgi:uncharacterized protein YndB with AHSA1/START domain
MTSTGKLKVTTPSDREIVMTRVFDAPRRLVWEAMTRPDLLRRWVYYPPEWQMTVCEADVRAGGRFRWGWTGPDGQPAMSISGDFREVVYPERIVHTETMELGCAGPLGEMVATLSFAEQGEKTFFTLHMLFPSKQARDGALASGMEHGVAAGYDKLEAMLQAGAR